SFTPDLQRYVRAAARLGELQDETDRWLDDHPIVLCPVTPVLAPVAAEGITKADGELMHPGGKLTLSTWANARGPAAGRAGRWPARPRRRRDRRRPRARGRTGRMGSARRVTVRIAPPAADAV